MIHFTRALDRHERGVVVQKCKSCGAEVEWVKTEAGKKLILDKDPIESGNVVVLIDGEGNKMARVVKQDELTDKPRRISHWATCPDADHWRGKKVPKQHLASNWVRKVSENTFRYILEKQMLRGAHLAIYQTLFFYGPLTTREVNDKLGGVEMHSRLVELERLGVVVEIGLKICSITRQESMSWDVTDNLPHIYHVMDRASRPHDDAIKITLQELRDLYQASRTRPSDEVKSVMLWLRSEVIP